MYFLDLGCEPRMDEHEIVRVVDRRLPGVLACTLLFQHEQVEPLRNV
jgi:hypothetical protein